MKLMAALVEVAYTISVDLDHTSETFKKTCDQRAARLRELVANHAAVAAKFNEIQHILEYVAMNV